jgi:DNA repair protein RecN (Recombination protein N)
MLKSLSIHNYAIIHELEINFGTGLNTMTGETGAGKSIILGALSLVLGERADTKVLFKQQEKCTVEAVFDQPSEIIKQLLEANELDCESETVLRREINASGKSRAFVNDTPVTLQVLKTIGEHLVNLHSQHETLSLTESGFQLEALDALAQNKLALAQYTAQFQQFKKDTVKLQNLVAQLQSATAENDFILFQLNELKEAHIEAGEQLQLEEEQSTLSNAESIKNAIQKTIGLIDEQEISVNALLAEATTELKQVKNFNKQVAELNERLQTIAIELKDIFRELENLADDVSIQPERLAEVNERLLLVHRLCKKHHVENADKLIEIQTHLAEKTSQNLHLENEIAALQKQLANTEIQLRKQAEILHEKRVKTAPIFAKQVSELLQKVGMPNASFLVEVKHTAEKQINENGFSDVQLLFSANKGIAPQPLKNVASGGELSRLMLCVKSVLAEAETLPTMIFDEIDTGISGEVAKRVGELMKQLSKNHQLICITHLPQIATAGKQHFHIFKEVKGDHTHTRIKLLSPEERLREVAKMLSGENITQAALANAKELIEN